MMKFLELIPKKVLISTGVIAASLVIFLALFFTLGGANSDAEGMRQRIAKDIEQAKKDLTRFQTDRKYVEDHRDQFEALLKSDRLVPHTRRVAMAELSRLATQDGLSGLNYNFKAINQNSPAAAQAKSTDAYRLSIEEIELHVSAPIDGNIYRFVRDLSDSFPGSAVVESVTLTRARTVTDDMLRLVAAGQDAKLVEGQINISWRTAQALEKDNNAKGGK
jgi:hypothetical protein